MRRCSVPGKCVGREAGHRPIWGRKCGQVVRETTLSQIFYGTSAQSRRGCPNNQLRVNGDDNRQVLWSFGGHGFVGHQLSTKTHKKRRRCLGHPQWRLWHVSAQFGGRENRRPPTPVSHRPSLLHALMTWMQNNRSLFPFTVGTFHYSCRTRVNEVTRIFIL